MNGVRAGSEIEMGEALEGAAQEAGIRRYSLDRLNTVNDSLKEKEKKAGIWWDKGKNWRG